MSERTLADRRIENRARRLLSTARRHETRAAAESTKAEEARNDLAAIWRDECERFGRDVPTDALILDLLGQIDVEEGDVWRWRGTYNNKGLPTVRVHGPRAGGPVNTEWSAVRVLAIAFGVIADDEYGMLFPTGDLDDVNPWHRTLRGTAGPVGNEGRFGFTPKDPAA